jgi:1-acyl-sn-glycerol-3-phosphate acyltransferase
VRSICGLFRMVKAFVHLLKALWMVAVHFPNKNMVERAQMSATWARQLLSLLNIQVRVLGCNPSPNLFTGNTLLIANHISWLDIIVMCHYTLPRFVGKKEMQQWPVVGRLATQVGTLFIDRTNRNDSHRVNLLLAQALSNGGCMAVFPEGTTTNGNQLLPFKVSLFESVRLSQGMVFPMVLRYVLPSGKPAKGLHYVGEQSFLASLWSTLTTHSAIVEVVFGQPIQVDPHLHHDRVELALAAYDEMANLLTQHAWLSQPIKKMQRIIK